MFIHCTLFNKAALSSLPKLTPPHRKTNKMTVRPAKTQNSLDIIPVWSESSLSAWRSTGSLATHWVHSEDCSDWVDAQADLSSLGAQVILLVLSCCGSYIADSSNFYFYKQSLTKDQQNCGFEVIYVKKAPGHPALYKSEVKSSRFSYYTSIVLRTTSLWWRFCDKEKLQFCTLASDNATMVVWTRSL